MKLQVFEGLEEQFISELEYELKVGGEEARFVIQYLILPKEFYVKNYKLVLSYLNVMDLIHKDTFSEELFKCLLQDPDYMDDAIAALKDCNMLTEELKDFINVITL